MTIHIQPVKAVASLRERCDHDHRPLEKSADYLLLARCSTDSVDGYFPLLDLLDDLMEIGGPDRGQAGAGILETIFRLKYD